METITINREFLNKIKANYLHYQREEENLSIYFTAESLHINRGTLFRIESGSLQISDDLFLLCSIFMTVTSARMFNLCIL